MARGPRVGAPRIHGRRESIASKPLRTCDLLRRALTTALGVPEDPEADA
jgi:hypothetical protein